VNEPKQQDKPFQISKWKVWEAYERVKANKGAAGVDDVSFAEFEQDRDKHLYRIWNRMSSGSYFPPPVKAVEIPKAGGKGVRVLGVPTISDRIAQTVARMYLEPEVEPVFHPDSYGYRPGKSALDAVRAGNAAGGRTGSLTWISKPSSTAFRGTSSSRRWNTTPTRSGFCCMCTGGCRHQYSGRMAHWSSGIVEPHRGRRFPRCWLTCSCIMRSMRG